MPVSWRLLALFSFLCGISAMAPAAVLSGVVTAGADHPLDGAYVSLRSVSTREEIAHTRADAGVYRFPGVPRGAYSLEIAAPGFAITKLRGIRVGSEEAVEIPIVSLQLGGMCNDQTPRTEYLKLLSGNVPSTGSLSGSIINEEAKAISGAQVQLVCERNKVCGGTTSDSEGKFSFPNLPAAERAYRLRVHRKGYFDEEDGPYIAQTALDARYQPVELMRCPVLCRTWLKPVRIALCE